LLLPEVKKVLLSLELRTYFVYRLSSMIKFWFWIRTGSCGSNTRSSVCGSKGHWISYKRNGRGKLPWSCSLAVWLS
jgi:hypothetical protein